MSFTPPDLSQILTNEQLMNTRLTTLRANLRTGLTNAGISYSQSDTINQLIDRYEILPIFQTDVNVNPQTAGKLGTVYKMANISAASWSSANNGQYHVQYTRDETQDQFQEDGWYYTATFAKFNTTPGTYYYGDNEGWKIESQFEIDGGWNGLMGIGFMVDSSTQGSGLIRDYNPNGYNGVFIGSNGGYPGVYSLDNAWGVVRDSAQDSDHPFASGTMILEKTDDYYLQYQFKDSNGNVFFSGTFDPGDVWNSDEIFFGAYGSTAYKSDSNTVCITCGTKIYYESL